MARADKNSINEYLLGRLTEPDEEQIELRLLADPEFAEEYDIVLNEVIDDYVAGKFVGEDLKQVEDYFFKSPERKNKLKFALALKQRKSEMVTIMGHKQKSYRPYLAIAASVLLVVGGFFIWRTLSSRNEVDKGLAALQSAFREERPLEARISNLNYAPYITTRGPGSGKVDENELNLAELTLRQALKNRPTPAVHHALGKVFLAKKDFDRAIAEFDEALKGDSNNAQLYSDLGAAWLEKGKIDRSGSEPGKGMPGKGMEELGHSLKNLNKALELNPNLLEPRFNRALCRHYMFLPQQAVEDWREYLKRDSSSSWAAEATQRLKALEDNAGKTGNQLIEEFDTAYKETDDARAWIAFCRSRTRSGNLIVDALIDKHLNLSINGRSDESRRVLEELSYAARIERAKANDRFTTDLARVYLNASDRQRRQLVHARAEMKIGFNFFNRGEFDQAATHFSEAQKTFRLNQDECEALFAQSWLGYCYLRTSPAEKNIALFARLCRDHQLKGYWSQVSQSLHALSDAQWGNKQFSEALNNATRGLRIAEEIDDFPSAIRCLTQMISVHRIFAEYSKSLALLTPTIEQSEELPPDPKLTWPVYQQAAFDFHGLNLTDAAIAFELEAVRQAEVSGVPLLKSRSLAQLGLLYGYQQKYQEAIKYGQLAFSEAEQVAGETTRLNIRAYSRLTLGESYLRAGSFAEAEKCFRDALALYQQLKLGAYDYEARKGRFLSFVGVGDDESADVELPIMIRLFEDYRSEISDESSRDQFFDSGQNTYDAAVHFTYTRRNDKLRAFNYAEASRARSLFEMMNTGVRISDEEDYQLHLDAATDSFDLARIQGGLPEQVQLLTYAVLDDRVLMWVVNRSDVSASESQTKPEQIDLLVREFLALLTEPTSDRYAVRSYGRKLYDLLVKPVAASLDPKRQLCIISDKSLNYLPFSALVAEDGKYLIERYSVTRAPSATVFIQLTAKAQERNQTGNEYLLAVGDPRFERTQFKSLEPLPAAGREVQQIASYYRSGLSLVGDEATASRVKSALSRADVIHFATHAVADERSPLLNKLLLTPDSADDENIANRGVFRAFDFYRIALPRTRLVVLSACQTAIERSYKGEGAIGLARPFIAANVPLVVASLWPVASEATADLMISFHRLRQKRFTIEALRQAQLEMIHNQASSSRPNYNWAAFTIIGGYAAF